MAAQMKSKKGMGGKAKNFVKGVRSEIRKVNWPNKSELTNHTFVVLSICAVVGILIWVFDTGIHSLFSLILSN